MKGEQDRGGRRKKEGRSYKGRLGGRRGRGVVGKGEGLQRRRGRKGEGQSREGSGIAEGLLVGVSSQFSYCYSLDISQSKFSDQAFAMKIRKGRLNNREEEVKAHGN